MTLTPCVEPFCGRVAEYRGRCRTHAQERERDTHRTGRLDPNSGRMYSLKRWTLLRRRRLFLEPLCRECGDVATEVDHITPIEQGGAPWELGNTQSLCKAHHSRKTMAERREQLA